MRRNAVDHLDDDIAEPAPVAEADQAPSFKAGGGSTTRAPSRADAEAAVRTLLLWAGDDPTREGLVDTPKRVAKAFEEFFAGYGVDPEETLARTFEETEGYDDPVMLRNVRIESHCEHHVVPIIGRATVAYLPRNRVVGISKLARVVDAYAKRLQIQEKLTAQISDAIDRVLQPRGVAVFIEAQHMCMATRGVHNCLLYTSPSPRDRTRSRMPSSA